VARRDAVVAVTGAALVAVVVLMWSKWLPYAEKVIELAGTRRWSGSSILEAGGVRPGERPSWHAAVSFTTAYGAAVWKALVAALLISAAIQAWVPGTWLLRLLDRPGRVRSAAVAGLASMPSMMCTCCTAPVAVGLRRRGVGVSAAVAYWLGNPLLNPAVLVFLVLVAPWQWAVTRILVGVLLVIGGAAVVSWFTDRRRTPGTAVMLEESPAGDSGTPERTGDGWLRTAPTRFARTLIRMALVLLPEYLLVVMLVGACRGWLLELGPSSGSAAWVLVGVAAVAGTLMVIPTGGEIPILHGLVLAGLSTGAVGALLITLPAASLPGIAMVGRSLGWRTTTATTVLVIAGGLIAAGLLTVL
jgi:hypothetical protein